MKPHLINLFAGYKEAARSANAEAQKFEQTGESLRKLRDGRHVHGPIRGQVRRCREKAGLRGGRVQEGKVGRDKIGDQIPPQISDIRGRKIREQGQVAPRGAPPGQVVHGRRSGPCCAGPCPSTRPMPTNSARPRRAWPRRARPWPPAMARRRDPGRGQEQFADLTGEVKNGEQVMISATSPGQRRQWRARGRAGAVRPSRPRSGQRNRPAPTSKSRPTQPRMR